MNFEREKKINRLLLQAQRFKDPYVKVPIELAEYAIKENFVREAQIYLSGLHLYSGKVHINSNPYHSIGKLCKVKERTVYDKIRSLRQRKWIGKDLNNGWIFFRGLDTVHELEGWKFSRSALMFKDDLKHFKAFLIGAVIANFIQSRGTGTERSSRGSEQSRFPVSISIVEKLFNVCEKTAFNYRKLAEKYRYIKMEQNLREVTGISSKDVIHLKHNGIDRIDLKLFGSSDSISIHPKQLRTDKGFIYAQLPNLITPKVQIGKRNMSREKPLPPTG
jgi:hypothetical protein